MKKLSDYEEALAVLDEAIDRIHAFNAMFPNYRVNTIPARHRRKALDMAYQKRRGVALRREIKR